MISNKFPTTATDSQLFKTLLKPLTDNISSKVKTKGEEHTLMMMY